MHSTNIAPTRFELKGYLGTSSQNCNLHHIYLTLLLIIAPITKVHDNYYKSDCIFCADLSVNCYQPNYGIPLLLIC